MSKADSNSKKLFHFLLTLLLVILPNLHSKENPDAFTKIAENGYVPCWSPNGEYIVYGGTRVSPNIFKVRVSDKQIEQLTFDRGYHPVVSPDGRFITYDSLGAIGNLLKMGFEDGKPISLTKEPLAGNFSSWSPEGEKIVYAKQGDL